MEKGLYDVEELLELSRKLFLLPAITDLLSPKDRRSIRALGKAFKADFDNCFPFKKLTFPKDYGWDYWLQIDEKDPLEGAFPLFESDIRGVATFLERTPQYRIETLHVSLVEYFPHQFQQLLATPEIWSSMHTLHADLHWMYTLKESQRDALGATNALSAAQFPVVERFSMAGGDGGYGQLAVPLAFGPLLQAPWLQNLKSIEFCYTIKLSGDVVSLCNTCHQLTNLCIEFGYDDDENIDMAVLDADLGNALASLKHLREFSLLGIYRPTLAGVEALAKAEWQVLEDLDLCFECHPDETVATPQALIEKLADASWTMTGGAFHLELWSPSSSEGVTALAAASWIRQLGKLSFRGCIIEGKHLRALAEFEFPHLTHLAFCGENTIVKEDLRAFARRSCNFPSLQRLEVGDNYSNSNDHRLNRQTLKHSRAAPGLT